MTENGRKASRQSGNVYLEVAVKMQLMAGESKSAEAREEFHRLAALYECLAVRLVERSGPSVPPPGDNPWQESSFEFGRETVRERAPRAPGVYGLWRQDRWVYVGECNDIQRRLLEHLAADKGCISREAPQAFGFEVCPEVDQRLERREELVRSLMPLCNAV